MSKCSTHEFPHFCFCSQCRMRTSETFLIEGCVSLPSLPVTSAAFPDGMTLVSPLSGISQLRPGSYRAGKPVSIWESLTWPWAEEEIPRAVSDPWEVAGLSFLLLSVELSSSCCKGNGKGCWTELWRTLWQSEKEKIRQDYAASESL